jgi:hypothetical protein
MVRLIPVVASWAPATLAGNLLYRAIDTKTRLAVALPWSKLRMARRSS